MHASFGPVRASQTVGSQVSHLHPENPTHFFTATAAPCTSLFKPAWMDIEFPGSDSEPAGNYDPNHLFWRHERLHRSTLVDYPRLRRVYQDERDEIEAGFVEQALDIAGGPELERSAFIKRCYDEAEAAEERWLAQVEAVGATRRTGALYQAAWRGFNQSMPDLE
jgi:dipeptidase